MAEEQSEHTRVQPDPFLHQAGGETDTQQLHTKETEHETAHDTITVSIQVKCGPPQMALGLARVELRWAVWSELFPNDLLNAVTRWTGLPSAYCRMHVGELVVAEGSIRQPLGAMAAVRQCSVAVVLCSKNDCKCTQPADSLRSTIKATLTDPLPRVHAGAPGKTKPAAKTQSRSKKEGKEEEAQRKRQRVEQKQQRRAQPTEPALILPKAHRPPPPAGVPMADGTNAPQPMLQPAMAGWVVFPANHLGTEDKSGENGAHRTHPPPLGPTRKGNKIPEFLRCFHGTLISECAQCFIPPADPHMSQSHPSNIGPFIATHPKQRTKVVRSPATPGPFSSVAGTEAPSFPPVTTRQSAEGSDSDPSPPHTSDDGDDGESDDDGPPSPPPRPCAHGFPSDGKAVCPFCVADSLCPHGRGPECDNCNRPPHQPPVMLLCMHGVSSCVVCGLNVCRHWQIDGQCAVCHPCRHATAKGVCTLCREEKERRI